jgi:hypothetical protein
MSVTYLRSNVHMSVTYLRSNVHMSVTYLRSNVSILNSSGRRHQLKAKESCRADGIYYTA